MKDASGLKPLDVVADISTLEEVTQALAHGRRRLTVTNAHRASPRPIWRCPHPHDGSVTDVKASVVVTTQPSSPSIHPSWKSAAVEKETMELAHHPQNGKWLRFVIIGQCTETVVVLSSMITRNNVRFSLLI